MCMGPYGNVGYDFLIDSPAVSNMFSSSYLNDLGNKNLAAIQLWLL